MVISNKSMVISKTIIARQSSSMEVKIYSKFKLLFKRICEEEYQISRYYSEKLLKYLADTNDGVAKNLLDSPDFSDLIFNCTENLQKLSQSNTTFIFEILSLLFRNELQFNKLQAQGLNLCIIKGFIRDNLDSKRPSAEMHLAFIRLSTVLLSHSSGMKVLIARKPWEHVLHPGLHRFPAHIAKAVYEYLTKLIWKLDECEDESTLHEIICAILRPINMSEYQTLEVFDTEKEKSYSESIIAPLHALLAILTDTSRVINSKCFVPILNYSYFVEASMPKLYEGTRDPDMIYLLTYIHFQFHFALIIQGAIKSGKTTSEFLNEIVVSFINSVNMLMVKKHMIEPMLEFIVNVNIFWAKTGSKLYPSTFERNGLKQEIDDQFLWHLMMPTITYVTTKNIATPEEIEEYNAKMWRMLTEHISNSGYRYRNMLDRADLKKVTIQNIKQVFKMKGLLKSKQAGLLFQTMFYLLQTFIIREDTDSNATMLVQEQALQTSDDVKLLSLTLAAIKMLLTEHNINWYDNLEIISLQNSLMNLMMQNALPTKELLQALDLLELSTRQFLSPDMTLLVESRHGGALTETTAAMRRYIQHEDWEVRDSALNLLLTCTDIAFIKYVPLQKLIIENKLIVLAAEAALSDPEYYVQATALKCLAAAARIETLWREVLTITATIDTHLIEILKHNTEGAVRTAAANALTQVYIYQHTSKVFYTCMCDVMLSAALDDLHWEVQLEALHFWQQVIKNKLTDRGMMDGRFPKVTFSKEKRKIIVLDEKEVKRQLASVMNDLSANGCLTALSRCLTEEYNIQVMQCAYCTTSKLVKILTSHHFDGVPNEDDAMAQSDTTDMDVVLDLSFVSHSTEKRDTVIEEIMNTKTSELIMKLNYETVKALEDIPKPAVKETIHPNIFLEEFKRTDYETIINNIKNWKIEPQSLDKVLDEILGDTKVEITDYCIE